MKKHLFVGLILASILVTGEAVAECVAFDLAKDSTYIPVLVRGRITQSTDVETLYKRPDKGPQSARLYKFTIKVLEVLKGEVNSDNLHFSYSFWVGCPGVETFKDGEERIFAVKSIGPNGDAELFGTSCGMTGVSIQETKVVNALREALASSDSINQGDNKKRDTDSAPSSESGDLK